MSSKYKFNNPAGLYFVSFAVKEWIDVFTRNEYKNIVVESLSYCQKKKGLVLYAWCIMSNHVHLIISSIADCLLQDILRDLKRYTSKTIVEAIRENPQESRKEWLLEKFRNKDGITFWGSDNHPIELFSNKVITQKLNYLHDNPVKEGLVFKDEQYVYSSAIDYAGEKGLLDLVLLSF